MKKLTFLHGVMIAVLLSLGASAVIATFTPFIGFVPIAKLVIPATALAYLLFLFRFSRERTGRLTTLSLWIAVSIATWWFSPPLGLYVLIHAAAIWLVRSLHFYSGVLPSLADLGLTILSISAFGWAVANTGSVFLGLWCFFLVQALFVVIPKSLTQKKAKESVVAGSERFDRARCHADRALRQIFNS